MTAFPKGWSATQNGYSGSNPSPYVSNLVLNFAGNPTTDDSFTFTGTFEAGGENSTISGSYDGLAKMITFVRVFQDIPGLTQTFIGFLGDGHPDSLSFGGSFIPTNYPGSSVRTQFGWFAQQTPLIP